MITSGRSYSTLTSSSTSSPAVAGALSNSTVRLSSRSFWHLGAGRHIVVLACGRWIGSQLTLQALDGNVAYH
jgi:hypothetical protein